MRRIETLKLFISEREAVSREIREGITEEAAGADLALRLREAKILQIVSTSWKSTKRQDVSVSIEESPDKGQVVSILGNTWPLSILLYLPYFCTSPEVLIKCPSSTEYHPRLAEKGGGDVARHKRKSKTL